MPTTATPPASVPRNLRASQARSHDRTAAPHCPATRQISSARPALLSSSRMDCLSVAECDPWQLTSTITARPIRRLLVGIPFPRSGTVLLVLWTTAHQSGRDYAWAPGAARNFFTFAACGGAMANYIGARANGDCASRDATHSLGAAHCARVMRIGP